MTTAMTPALACQRVSAAIAAILGPDGWQEPRVAPDDYGQTESENLFHKSYAVMPMVIVPIAGTERQPLVDALPVSMAIRVRWAWQSKALDRLASYHEAVGVVEPRIVMAVMSARRSSGLRLVFVSSTRGTDPDGFVRGEVVVTSQYALDMTS